MHLHGAWGFAICFSMDLFVEFESHNQGLNALKFVFSAFEDELSATWTSIDSLSDVSSLPAEIHEEDCGEKAAVEDEGETKPDSAAMSRN